MFGSESNERHSWFFFFLREKITPFFCVTVVVLKWLERVRVFPEISSDNGYLLEYHWIMSINPNFIGYWQCKTRLDQYGFSLTESEPLIQFGNI